MENRGALVVGVSHDTPAFAAHAIAHWWRQEGSTRYHGSRQLLILADTGGSNSCRCYAWKTELQSQLANSFALAVTVETFAPRSRFHDYDCQRVLRDGAAGGEGSFRWSVRIITCWRLYLGHRFFLGRQAFFAVPA